MMIYKNRVVTILIRIIIIIRIIINIYYVVIIQMRIITNMINTTTPKANTHNTQIYKLHKVYPHKN